VELTKIVTMKPINYYTPSGLAKLSGKATSTVFSALKCGSLPHVKTIDGARLIKEEDAKTYAKEKQ